MGIPEDALFAVARVQSTFANEHDRETLSVGAGFWMTTSEKRPLFVTSRHNVDPRGLPAFGSAYRTKRVSIQLRERTAPGQFGPGVRYFVPKGLARALWVHERADVALLAVEDWTADGGPYAVPPGVREDDIAGAATFATEIDAADPAMFVCFPASWADGDWALPLARTACIASRPSAPFRHGAITTDDALLVSGSSFGGSRGSPVWVARRNREKRVAPRRLIGILSGHLDADGSPDLAGLSYLTRSTSLLELVASARAASFTRSAPFDGLHPMAKV
jgi:hypothetical protein